MEHLKITKGKNKKGYKVDHLPDAGKTIVKSNTTELIRLVEWMNRNEVFGKYLVIVAESLVTCYLEDTQKPNIWR